MQTAPRLEILGAPGSPYTRKMLAVLRYRRIPYALQWGGRHQAPAQYPTPKVPLLPTLYFPTPDGGREAVVDSTPIVRRLESEYAGRSALPPDPVVGFLNDLVEDYADEWLTKAMFHYRWAHEDDIAHAGPLLVFWSAPTLDGATAASMAEAVSRRQIDRLYVVGSNPTTAQTIEASYGRLLAILGAVIERQGYVFGGRPASADFALYGQLTQLAIVEPTAAKLARTVSPRVRAWVDRLEDLSGVEPSEDDWITRDAAREALFDLFAEIGRVYAPFLVSNAAAVASGAQTFETTIDGRPWTQPVFPYQARCLGWLRDGFARLGAKDREAVRDILSGSGCELLLSQDAS